MHTSVRNTGEEHLQKAYMNENAYILDPRQSLKKVSQASKKTYLICYGLLMVNRDVGTKTSRQVKRSSNAYMEKRNQAQVVALN